METAQVGPTDLILLEGEQIAATLETGGGKSLISTGRHEALVLTDSRIIHSSTGGRHQGSVIVSVRDIDLGRSHFRPTRHRPISLGRARGGPERGAVSNN